MAIQINKMIKIKQQYSSCWLWNYATGLLYTPTSAWCTRRDPSVYALRTTHLWYLCNKQIHADLGVPIFADHIRALTKSFDSSWLVRVGPYFGKSERPSADWIRLISYLRANGNLQAIYKRPSRHNELCSALVDYP